MMTGVELVRRAVTFQCPDRVPYDLPDEYGSDFLWVGMDPDPAWKSSVPGEDEWGSIWSPPTEFFPKGDLIKRSLESYDYLKCYRLPDMRKSERYQRAQIRIAGNEEQKFVIANTRINFVERLKQLRGYEDMYTDPLLYPDELDELLGRLLEAQMVVVERFADIGVDGIFWCDDLGTQDRPIYSPEIFRQHFKPLYKKVYDYAHSRGMLTFLHSCGHILELLGDLKDAGLDVIQFDQQENMGVDNLARLFGGKICFWCPVDIQRTMVDGSPEDVARFARMLIEKLGVRRGGFIAKWFWAPDAVAHDLAKVRAMSEAFIKYGSYK